MSQYLAFTVGPSCSGKTTWAHQQDAIVVDSDQLREELYDNWADQTHHAEVFAEMQRRTITALREGHSVVYCATNLNMKKRVATLRAIKEACKDCDIQYICHVFAPLPVTLYQRNRERAHQVPSYIIQRQLTQFQMPVWKEGWSRIQLHSTDDSYDFLVQHLYMLELKRRMQYFGSQQNPHHTLSLYEHCQVCADSLPRKMKLVGFYHDCGKLDTQTIDENGVAHYYGHENVGAYYAAAAGFNEHDIALINYHMLPYQNETAQAAWRERLGDELWRDILILHAADEEAH